MSCGHSWPLLLRVEETLLWNTIIFIKNKAHLLLSLKTSYAWLLYGTRTQHTVWRIARECLEKNYSDHNWLVAKICTRLTRIWRFHTGKPRRNLKKPYVKRQKMQDTLGDKLGAIERESWNVEVHWNNTNNFFRFPPHASTAPPPPWAKASSLSRLHDHTQFNTLPSVGFL
jgi:hypothetical protein